MLTAIILPNISTNNEICTDSHSTSSVSSVISESSSASPRTIIPHTSCSGLTGKVKTFINTSAHTGRRKKSIPNKSVSRNDQSPGLHFRVSNVVNVLSSLNINPTPIFTYHNRPTMMMPSPPTIRQSPKWIEIPRGEEYESRWGDLWKSNTGAMMTNCSQSNNYSSQGSATNHSNNNCLNARSSTLSSSSSLSQTTGAWERPRSRSLSMLERRNSTSIVVTGDSEFHEDAGTPYGSNNNIINTPNGTSKRRASICTTSAISNVGSTSQGAHLVGSYYGGSLAHLVPNHFLQTTSRRISTHGAAPGCTCTSCGSTMTPYWRDGWATDVMLCNACGLRFQKFARRCPDCVYIPRKEDSLGDRCVKCGQFWVVGPSSSISTTGTNR